MRAHAPAAQTGFHGDQQGQCWQVPRSSPARPESSGRISRNAKMSPWAACQLERERHGMSKSEWQGAQHDAITKPPNWTSETAMMILKVSLGEAAEVSSPLLAVAAGSGIIEIVGDHSCMELPTAAQNCNVHAKVSEILTESDAFRTYDSRSSLRISGLLS